MKIKTTETTITWLLLIIITTSYALLHFRLDTDVMWHYKTGEYIIQNRFIPNGDIFSWLENLSWMCHEWLYDIFLYLSYSSFGATACRVLLIIATFLPFALSFSYTKKTIRSNILYLIFSIIVLLVWNSSNCARPSEFSVLLLMLAAIILIEDKKYKNLKFFMISVLCVNIHGGSIAQILVLPVLFIVSDFISGCLRHDLKHWRPSANAFAFLLGLIGSLINPYGIKIFKYTTNIFFGADFINSHIREWNPTEISMTLAIFLVALLLSLGTSASFKSFDQKTLRKYILICGFLCQGMVTRRMMFNAACIILLFAYPYFEEYIFTHILTGRKPVWIGRISSNSAYHTAKEAGVVFMAVLTIAFGIFSITSFDMTQSYHAIVEEKNPEVAEAIKYIKENEIKGRIYNHYNIGGFLILNDIKTYVDPRCDPFMEAFSNSTALTDYFKTMDAENTNRYDAWYELHKKYQFEYAMLYSGSASDRELIKQFKLANQEPIFENTKITLFKTK